MHDGGDPSGQAPRHEWLNVPAPSDDEALRLDRLSDACPGRQAREVLEGVLFEAPQAAGYSKRCLNGFWDTIQTEKRIIRLAASGHTNASIAELMGTTEGTIRNRRQRIRRLLQHLLPLDVSQVEYNRTGGNQQQACEIQWTYPGRRKPAPA